MINKKPHKNGRKQAKNPSICNKQENLGGGEQLSTSKNLKKSQHFSTQIIPKRRAVGGDRLPYTSHFSSTATSHFISTAATFHFSNTQIHLQLTLNVIINNELLRSLLFKHMRLFSLSHELIFMYTYLH